MRIKPSKQAMIGLVAVAVVLLLACCFTYFNRASRLQALQAQLKDREQQLADSEKTIRRLAVVEQQYEDAQANLSMLETGVSTKAYVPTLLRQLEELGKKVNLHVTGVRPKPAEVQPSASTSTDGENSESGEKKPEPYDKLDIDLEISGKYWDVVRFTYEITSFPKIIAVREMHISPVGQNSQLAISQSPMLGVRLNTTAFILRETPSRAEGSSSAKQASAENTRT